MTEDVKLEFKTPAQKQRALIRESEADIAKVCAGLTAVHESIAAMVARADAAGLSRDPLIAATIYALAKAPAPPQVLGVDSVGQPISTPVRVAVWTQQFVGDNADAQRAERVQRILTGGRVVDVPGVAPERVAQELLAGKDPSRLAPKPEAASAPTAKVQKDAAGWYGFRGSNAPVAPQPDLNTP